MVFLLEFSKGVLGCLYTLTGGNHFGPIIPKRSTVSKQYNSVSGCPSNTAITQFITVSGPKGLDVSFRELMLFFW